MVRPSWPFPRRPVPAHAAAVAADGPVWVPEDVAFAMAGGDILAPLRFSLAPGRVYGRPLGVLPHPVPGEPLGYVL